MSARSALLSDVVTYNLKVWLAGLSAAALVPLSIGALVLDFATGRADAPDAFARRVLRLSAHIEAAIDVHGDLTDVRVVEDAPLFDEAPYDEAVYEPA